MVFSDGVQYSTVQYSTVQFSSIGLDDNGCTLSSDSVFVHV